MWEWTCQAELGLKLNLKSLQGSFKLTDLTSGGLKGLCAGCHLLVKFIKLGDMKFEHQKMVRRWFLSYLIIS